MILLHGGLGSGEMFGPVLPTLAERHQVIVVDLHGHGRTADIDRPRRSARRPKGRSPPPLAAEVGEAGDLRH
jgi:pimeloyl-ACP methyl ester carboxylesterase